MRRSWLLLLASLPLSAQKLPETPVPPHDEVKPFSWNIGVAGRYHDNPRDPYGVNLVISCGLNYRFDRNHMNANVAIGFAPDTQTVSAVGSISRQIKAWGRRR